jgi:hypothetical protein
MMFFLFTFREHEQRGGVGDYVGGFDTIEAAKAAHAARNNEEEAHIAVVRDGELVIIEQIELEPSSEHPGYLRYVWRAT